MTDPEKVLAAALRATNWPGTLRGNAEHQSRAILAAMPDHTVVRRSELAALRALLPRLPPEALK